MKILLSLLLLYSAPLLAERLDADSVQHCINRGRTALSIAQSIEEGLKIENINLAFFTPPRSTEDQLERDAWSQQLKEEVATALGNIAPNLDKRAARAAQKVMEACAYQLGRKRLKTVASNEFLAGSAGLEAKCREWLLDHMVIGRARAQQMPREMLEARAIANRAEFGEERYEKVMRLIGEAYAAEDIQEWFNGYRKRCMGAES